MRHRKLGAAAPDIRRSKPLFSLCTKCGDVFKTRGLTNHLKKCVPPRFACIKFPACGCETNCKRTNMEKVITIVIRGETEGDLDAAFDQAVRDIRAGNTSGGNRNDTGSYTIDVTEGE